MKQKNKTIVESFDKLKGLMREKRYTQTQMAIDLDMSISSLNHKLNGTATWQWNEMEKILKLLDIPCEQIGEYFFASMLRNRNIPA